MTAAREPPPRDDPAARSAEQSRLGRARRGLLRRVSQLLDWPMTLLAFVWIGLMIVEFTSGLTPALELANYAIWALFILHFTLEFWIAPGKLTYLKRNWLTAIALVVPAFRTLRVFRAFRLLRVARFSRSVRLVRVVTSLNRGMKAAQQSMRRRGLNYVIALTLIVNFAGAAAMYGFESPAALRDSGIPASDLRPSGIRSYGESLWWTAMMLTTMGSDYFPQTNEGRITALLLAIYGFAIFGYITATVASLIIRVDQPTTPAASDPAIERFQADVIQLRQLLTQALAESDQLKRQRKTE